MQAEIEEGGKGLYLVLGSPSVAGPVGPFTEHDLRDIEFALALRRAMGTCCPEVNGEHTCSLAPGHGGDHLCRACDICWFYIRALP